MMEEAMSKTQVLDLLKGWRIELDNAIPHEHHEIAPYLDTKIERTGWMYVLMFKDDSQYLYSNMGYSVLTDMDRLAGDLMELSLGGWSIFGMEAWCNTSLKCRKSEDHQTNIDGDTIKGVMDYCLAFKRLRAREKLHDMGLKVEG